MIKTITTGRSAYVVMENAIINPNVDGWRKQAACWGAPVDAFYPGEDGPNGYRTARTYCARCPVAAACLQYALDTDTRVGMYGGMTPEERRKIARGEILLTHPMGAHGEKAGTTAGYYRERAAGVQPCGGCLAAYNRNAADKRANARARRTANV